MYPNKNNTQTSKMTTITMPRAFDGAIQEIIIQARAATVQALSEKYGFDETEAQRFLEDAGVKVVKMRGPVPKAKKVTRTKDDGSKPKTKRATGYLMFSADQRAIVKEELLHELSGDAKLAPQAVVKELAVRWKALDEEERDDWNSQAALVTLDASA